MIALLTKFFMKLTEQKGEDIFEYGFHFDNMEKDYLDFLLQNKYIKSFQYEEFLEDDDELFQIIENVHEDYEKCLEVFATYLVTKSDIDLIVGIMIAVAED